MVFKKNVSPFTERLKSLYRKGIRGVNGLHLAFTQPSRCTPRSANGQHAAENAHRFSENAHRFPASEHALIANGTLLSSGDVLLTYLTTVFSPKMHFSPFGESYVKGHLRTCTPAHPLSTRVPQPLGEGESKFLKSLECARTRTSVQNKSY
jgi:hypothetical protein